MSADKQPPQPAANDESSQLATLKALLLGPEKSSIERLQREARDPGLQTRRVADALPESLQSAYLDSPGELTRALERPVSECIEDSVQRNPGRFADILFPVMGPAIRRSVAQAMKGLVQQINQTLEHSLTLKGLKWRMEAARSGIPFAEVVLRHTLLYRVEEVFLIQGGSGLLIQHLSQVATRASDADAVSAMLTAIRDFAHDTMDRDDEDSRLETVDIGDHTLWLIHGPKAFLACAIRGVPPVGLRDDLAAVVEQVHHRHAALLENFDGDPQQAAPLIPLLEPCLRAETERPSGSRFPWPLALLATAIIGLLAWWAYGQWQAGTLAAEHSALQRAAVTRLAASPGIVLTGWEVHDGQLQLRGLHDPLTPTPDSLLAKAGLGASDYRLDFRSFQSSDPSAAIERARQRLAPPDTVELAWQAPGKLAASGVASAEWRARAALLAATVPGVEHYDDSRIEGTDQRLQRQLRELLQPPAGVDIRVRDGVAAIIGQAPIAWIRALPDTPPELAGLRGLRAEQLYPAEARRLDTLAQLVEHSTVDFVSGIELGEPQLAAIESLASLLSEMQQIAQELQQTVKLQIIGRTDGTGSPEQNRFVARERATRVAQALLATDLTLPAFILGEATQPAVRTDADADLRRVEFRVLGLRKPADGLQAGQ